MSVSQVPGGPSSSGTNTRKIPRGNVGASLFLESFLKTARSAYREWCRFWFDSGDARWVAVYRVLLSSGLFFFYLSRQFDYEFLYSNDGVLPFSHYYHVIPEPLRSPIPYEWLARIPEVGQGLHALFLLLLLLLAFGIIGRGLAWFAFILHMVFICRNPLLIYGPDMVGTFFLAYLAMMDSNRFASPWKRSRAAKVDALTSVGVRLVQVQVCIIYLYSGFEKAKGNSWWQGDALWRALSNGQLVSWDFGLLKHFPMMIAVSTFTTVLWETYFPVLVWVPRTRYWMLGFGVFLHLLIAFTLNIPFFSWFMCATYVLFLPSVWAERLFKQKQMSAI